jgi:uncharacterized protein (DUF302 family)
MTTTFTAQDCSGTVAEVLDRLTAALRDRGIQLFTVVDHAAGARSAGLELRDEVVAVFGNPAVGTALMQRDPAVGYELPLRLLIWDADGTTRVGYEPPGLLAEHHDLAGAHDVLQRLDGLMAALVAEIR